MKQDFTELGYRLMISKLKEHKNSFLIRHDVDYSIEIAEKMAILDNALGISSIFFIRLDCNRYNIFQKSCRDILMKILHLGHKLGIHPDHRNINPGFRDIPSWLEYHKKMLSAELSSTEITELRWHEPNHERYNNYEHNYGYVCSDSLQRWKYGHPLDMIEQHEKIEVLIHPELWL